MVAALAWIRHTLAVKAGIGKGVLNGAAVSGSKDALAVGVRKQVGNERERQPLTSVRTGNNNPTEFRSVSIGSNCGTGVLKDAVTVANTRAFKSRYAGELSFGSVQKEKTKCSEDAGV